MTKMTSIIRLARRHLSDVLGHGNDKDRAALASNIAHSRSFFMAFAPWTLMDFYCDREMFSVIAIAETAKYSTRLLIEEEKTWTNDGVADAVDSLLCLERIDIFFYSVVPTVIDILLDKTRYPFLRDIWLRHSNVGVCRRMMADPRPSILMCGLRGAPRNAPELVDDVCRVIMGVDERMPADTAISVLRSALSFLVGCPFGNPIPGLIECIGHIIAMPFLDVVIHARLLVLLTKTESDEAISYIKPIDKSLRKHANGIDALAKLLCEVSSGCVAYYMGYKVIYKVVHTYVLRYLDALCLHRFAYPAGNREEHYGASHIVCVHIPTIIVDDDARDQQILRYIKIVSDNWKVHHYWLGPLIVIATMSYLIAVHRRIKLAQALASSGIITSIQDVASLILSDFVSLELQAYAQGLIDHWAITPRFAKAHSYGAELFSIMRKSGLPFA